MRQAFVLATALGLAAALANPIRMTTASGSPAGGVTQHTSRTGRTWR